jgi:hypothetical protein
VLFIYEEYCSINSASLQASLQGARANLVYKANLPSCFVDIAGAARVVTGLLKNIRLCSRVRPSGTTSRQACFRQLRTDDNLAILNLNRVFTLELAHDLGDCFASRGDHVS